MLPALHCVFSSEEFEAIFSEAYIWIFNGNRRVGTLKMSCMGISDYGKLFQISLEKVQN